METKNIKVVKSNTPYWILLKWERKDNDPIASVTQTGAQDLTLDKINPNPAITIIKQLIVDIMNAITWFLVKVERHEVSDKKEPAINQLPTYEMKITPLSGLPK